VKIFNTTSQRYSNVKTYSPVHPGLYFLEFNLLLQSKVADSIPLLTELSLEILAANHDGDQKTGFLSVLEISLPLLFQHLRLGFQTTSIIFARSLQVMMHLLYITH
jgi:hypothetical protein